MKKTYLTPILSAVLLTATAITAPSCINDLDISSIDPQSSSSFDQQGTFVKQYALLGLTDRKDWPGLRTWTDRMKENPVSTERSSTVTNFLLTNAYGYGKTM